MYPVDVPHTKYEICLVMAILWFALIFMSNFVCLGDTETPGRLFIYYCGDEHMHARYYFLAIVFLFIHYLICVQRRSNTGVGEIDMTTQTDASRTPDYVIGQMWARFVSRTLDKDEIANLKNTVQVLERWLECSWTREEVLVHSLNASAFAREIATAATAAAARRAFARELEPRD